MAGSFRHVTTKKGKLRSNESFAGMIDNLGDAYEAVEEMYGMIWWLAANYGAALGDGDTASFVENARENYRNGIEISPGVSS